ncbi:DoxX family protein [Aurantimonas endophytica]|uniref:Putative oxidoreductase n=1 Tax=Aurantimonas endophytica TaxID=1522175 RepID=A0A7W6MRZ6_9HYPH|nr:DoxX family protein [Aurantimonas endophytica]MBB4005582.1 putative oxidoreductase [Aurantimonas endophytica]MCO6406452.1 DoxX family membrane protein [Aurantimonas endophytica]
MPAMQIPYIGKYAPHLLSVLRIFAAGSFFTHGTMKLFSWPGPFEYPLSPLLYTAGVIEVAGGLLLAIGLFSRPVAFVLSGLMAFAYFIAHSSNGFFPVLNHGEAAMLYCFLFLYISAAGPGLWSLDAITEQRAGATSSRLASTT